MARINLLKTVQFPDELLNRFQANVKDAIETLAQDHDVLSSPTSTLIASGQIQAGKSVVLFGGGRPGQSLTLPLAKWNEQAVAALVAFANVSTQSVTLLAAANNTINGVTSLAVAAGAMILLLSDGDSKWLALT